MRSPAFAYAVCALVITIVLFVATIPAIPGWLQPTPEGVRVADKPKPQPKNDEYVEPRTIAHEFGGNCAAAVRNSNAYGVLTRAIGEFEDTGDLVSFAVRDLTNGNELNYDSLRIQYPASSIKAPYTACVYQKLIEPGETTVEAVYPLAQDTIVESSDEAYHELRGIYGSEVFLSWLQDAHVGHDGYESYEEMMRWNYPHMNANQLLGMWVHMYDYLQSDTAPARQLADLLSQRTTSAMRVALGPEVRTWGKMGWFEFFGDYGSEPATVECGVVAAEEGRYAGAVMTTAPAQSGELEPIFTAIARAHYEML